MKCKRALWGRFLLALGLVLLFLPAEARADMGPKPSVNISFTGIQDVEYCGTLLSEAGQARGPFLSREAAREEGTSWEWWGNPDALSVQAKDRLLSYEDPDGFQLLNWCCDCTEENTLVWDYWPPETFKVLLYFPGEDRFCVSPAYTQYAYDSYYTADLSDWQSGRITLEKNYDYTWELLSLAVRVVLTIALELGMAVLCFGRKEPQVFRFLAGVNIATQLFLNLSLNAMNYFNGIWDLTGFHTWPYYGLELLVMLAEGILYMTFLPRLSGQRPSRGRIAGYTIAANLISFAAGLWLAAVIPGIF